MRCKLMSSFAPTKTGSELSWNDNTRGFDKNKKSSGSKKEKRFKLELSTLFMTEST